VRIDGVCTRFEAAWLAGIPPRIEDFLAAWQGPGHDAFETEARAIARLQHPGIVQLSRSASTTPDGNVLTVADLHKPPHGEDNAWPLPDGADRRRYQAEQADRAERERRWYAVAFHVGRLLLDDPTNADLGKHRDDARARHTAKPTP